MPLNSIYQLTSCHILLVAQGLSKYVQWRFLVLGNARFAYIYFILFHTRVVRTYLHLLHVTRRGDGHCQEASIYYVRFGKNHRRETLSESVTHIGYI